LAAAGIFALQNNIERLANDHQHARKIAAALLKKPFTGKMMPVETNIIIFEVTGNYTAKTLAAAFKKYGILVMAISDMQVRMVLHLDVTEKMVEDTIKVIEIL
ncbi:MAG: threonine aldolase, partial [Ginsengibacter sp.]